MRLTVLSLLVAASVAAAQKPASDPGFARLPGPALRIADSVRIDAKAAKLETPLTLFAGPRGGLVVFSQWSTMTGFDSSGRRIWSRAQNRDREIAEITALGWNADGSEMWVSDQAYTQIALLDQYGNVTKSIELPSWVRPSFSNRKSFPVFESMRVLGRYADGSMVVVPRSPLSLVGATGYDKMSTYILKVNEDGVIQRTLAKFPSNMLTAKGPEGQDITFDHPMYRPLYRVSADGMRIVTVSVDTTSPKVDTVTLRALNERGDTVYMQKFAYPALKFTESQIDSIARFRWGNDTEYRERRAKVLPRRAPPVSDLVMDTDKSVWLTMRGTASARSVIGFDPAGKVIGKFELPARRAVKAADRGRVWTAEVRSDIRGDITRYRMVRQ